MIGPCISIFYSDIPNILKSLDKIPSQLAIEIRLDRVDPREEVEIPRELIHNRTSILTIRTVDEGGYYDGGRDEIFELYGKAIRLNPDYIDVGIGIEGHDRILKLARDNGIGTILSYHNPLETPSYRELMEIYRYIDSLNPDIIKIVTYAERPEDNDEIVKLLIKTRGKRMVTAFCMGSIGRISRIYNLLLRGAVTYISLGYRGTAEGQITLDEYLELKEVYRYV